MNAPVIMNPYTKNKMLTAFVGKSFSTRIPVVGTALDIEVGGDLNAWSYAWLPKENEIELSVVPKNTVNNGLLYISVKNEDGRDKQHINYRFINANLN